MKYSCIGNWLVCFDVSYFLCVDENGFIVFGDDYCDVGVVICVCCGEYFFDLCFEVVFCFDVCVCVCFSFYDCGCISCEGEGDDGFS